MIIALSTLPDASMPFLKLSFIEWVPSWRLLGLIPLLIAGQLQTGPCVADDQCVPPDDPQFLVKPYLQLPTTSSMTIIM